MNKREFMVRLESRIRGLSADDKKDALDFYDEYLSDAGLGDEDDVTELVGTPEVAAKKIIDDLIDSGYGAITGKEVEKKEEPQPATDSGYKTFEEYKEERDRKLREKYASYGNMDENPKPVKAKKRVLWPIILGVFAAPIALPLLIAAGAIFFALVVTIFALFFSVIVTGGALMVGGFFAAPGIVLLAGLGQKLVCAGTCILLVALGLLIVLASKSLYKVAIKLIVGLYNVLFRRETA